MDGSRIHPDPAFVLQVALRAAPNLQHELTQGLQLIGKGRFSEAAIAFEEVSLAFPDLPWATLLAGYAYLASGNIDDAIHFLQTAVHQQPADTLAWYVLGIAWRTEGNLKEAVHCFEKASSQGGHTASARLMQGVALSDLGLYSESRATLAQLAIDYPQDPEVQLQLGLALLKGFGEANSALAIFRSVASAGGASRHSALLNQAYALRCLGEMDESISLYDRLVRENDTPSVRWQRALALLYAHEYERAWVDYEHRTILTGSRRLDPACPIWSPPARAGETVLVVSEQGLGDQILFSTCLPELVREVGPGQAKCVVECNPRLVPLFSRSFPSVAVVARSEVNLPGRIMAESDSPVRQILAGSLPFHFRRKIEDFPRVAKFLRADPGKVRRWSKKLQSLGQGRKVGIVWRGGTPKTNAALRTVPLRLWQPIFSAPGCVFVSLQHGDCEAELSELSARGHTPASWAEAMEDIDEMAALIEALDVVVSVTATVVHLAGGLGKPCFVLTPSQPEWAFAGLTSQMHWYPSVTLVRQKSVGDWSDAIRIAAEAVSA